MVREGVRPSYDELAALVAAQAVELLRAREEIIALRAEVAALKRRLGTDSGNSSMPPSSDRFSLAGIPAHVVDPLISRFVRTVNLGLLLHSPDRDRKQSKTRNLLVRLRDHRHQVLLFAGDLTVPFTNNQAERDPRMIKAQLKISGGWRTRRGAYAWLRVRSHISTARKNGLHIITALRDAITGNPWLPPTIEMA